MKIYKILKHDGKEYIYIKDHSDNHAYIISILAVTLMSFINKIEHNQDDFNEMLNLLLDPIKETKYQLDTLLEYQKNSGLPIMIEVINVIDSVKPFPQNSIRKFEEKLKDNSYHNTDYPSENPFRKNLKSVPPQ